MSSFAQDKISVKPSPSQIQFMGKASVPDCSLAIWFRQPAKEWIEALPVGNGRLGGMVFGGVDKECIQLNEKSLWAGGRWNDISPEGLSVLPAIRKLLFDDKPKEAFDLASSKFLSRPLHQPPYQTLGNLWLDIPSVKEVTEYRRELNLETGIVTVSYRSGDTLYKREVFASEPDQVMVVRITADKPGMVSLIASMEREKDAEVKTIGSDRLVLQGQATLPESRFTQEEIQRFTKEGFSGTKFQALIHVNAKGGKIKAAGGKVIVENANNVTIYIAAATDFNGKSPAQQCENDLSASMKIYNQIRKAHIKDHQKYFNRVSLNLGDSGELSKLPTDERLAAFKKTQNDPGLMALYFQFGRYLLMGSSRPGDVLPANLQGIWCDKLAPSWDSKFTININTEMNYWPAESCNLTECHQPLFDLSTLR